MLVGEFMVKKEHVVTCSVTDPLSLVVDLMLEKSISSVVVLGDDDKSPEGIITKSDLVQAYQKKIGLDTQAGLLMNRTINMVSETAGRDDAATTFEDHGNHHALVVNADKEFVGLVSSLDIATEVAKDGKAWPWFRQIGDKLNAAH